ncbi:FKBP-type peptidyl-prolyl cis-trans isomerase [Allopontixanthobacter sediminis]|uniref:Peptidyl-prolyl cis-trans isomerase n=1 Tax=Allopontixanthobacter sediminis TaxID=1689985 RepID=A0A845B1I5_9SPHN|nr:FKBP-type peptidyl-prolyl cis-trans isomerase [Allopontixanthobacter sediminis]MXP45121.1 FKBP-type peptidyl-prolyl cis-trans isomerase [Allopontixanthobacter sediminis]
MTEITRVPLHPIARGSLTKLWLGVVAVILIGAGIAYAAMPAGVSVETVTAGAGPNPSATDVVLVNYTGKLADGTVFDEGQQTPLPLEGMIPGFREGAMKMQKGGTYLMTIPSEKGYGAESKANPQTGEEVIPANSDLVFDVELIDFMSLADFQARMAEMQQMQQMMQQQQQGAPGAPPPPAPPQP